MHIQAGYHPKDGRALGTAGGQQPYGSLHQAVSGYAGIPADDPINPYDRDPMIRIVAGMSKVENG